MKLCQRIQQRILLKLNPKITETRNVSVNCSEEAGTYQEDEKSSLNVKGGKVEIHLPKEKSFKEKLKRFFRRNKAYREL